MLLLLWMGCQGGAPTDGGAAPPGEGGASGVGEDGSIAPPGAVLPLNAKLTFLGASEIVPRTLSVQLDRPIFGRELVGSETRDFALTLEPPVEGTLVVTAENTLEWTPTAPLRPGASYEATLARVTAPEGEPAAGPWKVGLEAPEFRLLRATLRSQAPPGGIASIDLVFSAPPTFDSLGSAIRATIGGQPVDLSLGSIEGSTVSLSVHRPHTGGDALAVTTSDQVVWAGDPKVKAAKGEATVSLASGPEVSIEDVFLREGGQGWYFEVVCDDDAAPGSDTWRWLPELGGWELSSRCLLDDTWAARSVHTDPPIPLTFAPGMGGFRVFGDFPRGDLKLMIDGGTTTVDGGMTHDAWDRTFQIQPRSPSLSFDHQGRYLPRSAWKSLAVRHLNVDRLDIEVRHVPEEDLVFWMTGTEPTTPRTSNRVATTSMAVRNQPDEEVSSTFSVAALVPDPQPGVYEVNVRSEGRTASSRILLTDLHLVAKAEKTRPGERFTPRIRVWGLDVHTGVTRDDVTVRAIRASGATLASCEAKGDRGCVLELPQDDVDDSPPVALVATRGDDMTYLEFEDLHLDLPADVGGPAYTAVSPYDAPMWTDRGVYRPGDVAHVAALVRDGDHVAPPAGLPVVVRVFDPKERETRKRVVATNAAGLVATDVPFGDYASTGRYRVVAEIGDETIGETTFQVEEFVPERLAVKATAKSTGTLPDESVDVEVSGQWLFGGSAEGSGVELTCNLVPSTFQPDGFDGWSFGPAWLTTRPATITLGTVHGELDAKGLSTVTCPAATSAVQGAMQLVAQAAVFEGESGRTTVAEARVPVHPERYWIGLDSSVTRANAGQPIPIKGVVVDWKGQPVTGKRKITLETVRMEEEYGWWWDEEEGTQQRRTLRPAREEIRDVEVVDGKFALEVTPRQNGAGLLVRARSGDTTTERWIEGTGSRYWWDDSEAPTVDSTPRPMRPTRLPIRVEGDVKVGEITTASLDAPYAGRVLWTVETDEVVDAVWMQAAPGRNEWRFKVDAFTPNVYVSAFLVKDPHLESFEAFLPDRAFGVTSVRVSPEKFDRALTLAGPDEVLPNSKLELDLDLQGVTGPAFATVAAVDEGILSLTRFESPDPLAVLFRRRALGVDTYETIGWTRSVEAAGPSSSTGGDEEGGGRGNRVQMVKPVALWSGIVELDAQGHGHVSFDVPGYRGKLRVMAVAATAQTVGHAEKAVVVRDPLVLMTTLPRFLVTGDTTQIPVQVTNTTSSAKDVTVKLEATELQRGAKPDMTDGRAPMPILAFTGPTEGALHVEPGASATAVFEVKVRPKPGAAHFVVTATSGRLRSKEELDLPIEMAQSPVRQVKSLLVSDKTLDVKPTFQGFVDGTDRSTLWLTANPYADSLVHLRYLVNYPFG